MTDVSTTDKTKAAADSAASDNTKAVTTANSTQANPATTTPPVTSVPPFSDANVGDKKPEAGEPGTLTDADGVTGLEAGLKAQANVHSRAEDNSTKMVPSSLGLTRKIDPNFDPDSRIERGRKKQAARAKTFREQAHETADAAGIDVD